MSLYVITYDVRAKNHDYASLYKTLNGWKAAHLQDSVWLAELQGPTSAIRDFLKAHMHTDDTICVIQIFPNSDWATQHARPTGNNWMKAHLSA